jgi:hypothetical protein
LRLLSISALGAALVAGALVAPATGEATSSGSNGIKVSPGTARPGQRVELTVRGCSVGPDRHWARSTAFTKDVTLQGKGADGLAEATIKKSIGSGSYDIVAHCGSKKVTGHVKISRRSLPFPLPSALNNQAARFTK